MEIQHSVSGELLEELGESWSCNESCECLICKAIQESLIERRVRTPAWVRRERRHTADEAEELRRWVLRQRMRPCGCRRAFSFLHPHSCRRLGISARLRAHIQQDLLRTEDFFVRPPRRAGFQ